MPLLSICFYIEIEPVTVEGYGVKGFGMHAKSNFTYSQFKYVKSYPFEIKITSN